MKSSRYEELLQMSRSEALYLLNYNYGDEPYEVKTVSTHVVRRLYYMALHYAKHCVEYTKLGEHVMSIEAAREVVLRTNQGAG